jgi:uncharacterized membrane protein YoaT (DUF817 family)
MEKKEKKSLGERLVVNYFMPVFIVSIVMVSMYGMIFDHSLEMDIRKICGAIVLNAFILSIVLLTKLRVNTKEITIVEPSDSKGGDDE